MDESEVAPVNDKSCDIAVLKTLSKEGRDRNRVMEKEKENEQQDRNHELAQRHPLLKYAYKDDQWSPLNLSGKRVYDREFLIELWDDPKSFVKPLNLPDVAIVLKHNIIKVKNRHLKRLKNFNDVKQCVNEEPDRSDTTPEGPPLLKYTYEPDQSSPLNVSGRRVYDREFLIKLQSHPNSNIRPLNLPDLDVVLKENSRSLAAKRVSQQSKPKKGKPVVIRGSCSMEEDIKLRESENPWRPSGLKSDVVSKYNDPSDSLYKTVRRVLNKMMPEKFDKLLNQVKTLQIGSREELQGVVNLVFDKAVAEPRFVASYALMCKELAMMQISGPEGEASKQNNDLNFRKLIITRCVMEFEEAVDQHARFIKKQETEGLTNLRSEPLQALSEQERINRTKFFGNIRFIGELFKQEVLTTFIMHRCIRYLLTQIDDESLECLCQLLITVGKPLESKKQKLDPYFEQMLDIVHRKVPGKVSSRVRFMLQDVIELRTSEWIPRKGYSDTKMVDLIKIDGGSTSLSEEQLTFILEAYLSDTSNSKAALEACETFDNSTKAIFVREVLNRVVDRSATARKQVSQLITNLISKNILPMYLYNLSLAEVLDTAEDLEIDNPNIWVYLAELIWYPLAEGVVLFSELKTAMTPLQNKGLTGKLMGELMVIALREKGPESIEDRWHQASPKLSDFLQEDESLDDKIKKYPSMNNFLSDDKNVSGNVSADIPKTMEPKKSTTLDNTSIKHENFSVLPIPRSLSTGLKDHGSPAPKVSCPSASTISKSPALTSKKGLAKKSAIILDNYLADAHIDTATERIRQTFDDSTFANFVREALSKVVNKSQAARMKVSQLMTHLISNNILQSSLYLSSLGEILDASGDVVIDVSKIWVSLAELIWYPLAEGVVPFFALKTTMAPLKNKGLAGTLMGELMIVLVREKRMEWTKDIWDQSGLKWSDFLGENESLDDFIKKYKLEFMLRDSSSSLGSSSGLLNIEQIHKQLLCLMSNKKKNSLDNICTWISANVGEKASEPEFIKVLMTTILEASIDSYYNTWQFRVDRFQNLQALIPRYIDVNIKLSELQCLIAIQEYIHQLDAPQRVLLQILEKQIFESILSFDVYHVWESNKDLMPLEGKSIAMLAVKSFFTSLKETNNQSGLNKT